MHDNLLAVGFALIAALVIAWGTVVRHRIAAHQPDNGDSPIVAAAKRPLWWFALLTALSGYGFQVLALGFGTLLIVQPVLALTLMFTFPMTAFYEKRRLTMDEIIGGALLTVSVATLVILGKPVPFHGKVTFHDWLPAIIVTAIVMGIIYAASIRMSTPYRGLSLGVITGIVYGFVAVLSKAAVNVFNHGGVLILLTVWEFYALIACAVFGTIIQQYAFNVGALRLSLPAMTTLEPVVAFILSYTVLGEKFQVHGWNWVIMGIALVTMILSTFALSARGNA